MYWLARLDSGKVVTNRPRERSDPPKTGVWKSLITNCKIEDLNIVEMCMPGPSEATSLATPKFAKGYWHAYGMHSIQGVGESKNCGIGWVDDEDVLNIIWRNSVMYWSEQREAKGENIIWNAR